MDNALYYLKCKPDYVQLCNLLTTMGIEQEGQTPVYEDNELCMLVIVFVPVGTDHQLADIMTNALGSAKFDHCADKIIVSSEDFE
eukprot:1445626-Rhodomonas_salina.2